MIYERYGIGDLMEEELEMVRAVEDTLLYYQFEVLMEEKIFDKVPKKISEHDFLFKDFFEIENEFIDIFNKLIKQ